jgi:hypothetical protein
MKQKYLIEQLKDIAYNMGRYSGKWVNCNNRLALAEDMLEYMEDKAKNYGIEIKTDLKDYFVDDEEYNELVGFGMEYVYDDLIYRLYNTITEKIMEMLL